MKPRGELGAARENEISQRRQLLVGLVDPALHLWYPRGRQGWQLPREPAVFESGGCREMRPDRKQIFLYQPHPLDQRRRAVLFDLYGGRADRGVELVDFSIRLHAQAIFSYSLTTEECRFAGI